MSTDNTPHLEQFSSYEQARRELKCELPERFNVAEAVCRRHDDPVTRIALLDVRFGGVNTYTFGGLDFLSDKFARVLVAHGAKAGDRLAIVLAQSAAAVVALLGALKAGLSVAMIPQSPSSITCVEKSNTAIVVLDSESYAYLSSASNVNARAWTVFVAGHRLEAGSYRDFWSEINKASSDFKSADTDGTQAGFCFLDHLTTGEPHTPSLEHSHASVLAALPGFEMANELDCAWGQALYWTPHDWCSAQTVIGMLFPVWWYGGAVLALDRGLPAGWLAAIDRYSVTHAVLSPVHLRLMREAGVDTGPLSSPLRRVITDAPIEPVLKRLCELSFGAETSILAGWPEAPSAVASCNRWFPTREGWLGRAAPGTSIEIFDAGGSPVMPGSLGYVGISRDSSGPGWLMTGSTGLQDSYGGIWLGGEGMGR